jgi:hypothetical protein
MQKSMRDTAEKMNALLVHSIAEYEQILKDIGASDLIERTGVIYIYHDANNPRVLESTKLRDDLKVKQILLAKKMFMIWSPILIQSMQEVFFFQQQLILEIQKKYQIRFLKMFRAWSNFY